jgi:flagellin
MREVSVQAANDTNNDQDRKNLQAEMNALITEIDRIAGTTTWAGEKLMEDEQGSFFSFQVGAATGEKNQIDVTIGGMGANILGFATPAADDSATADDGGSDTPAATGDPVASMDGNTLTVDGAAAAAGDLVLSFPGGGADITVTLTGSQTESEIATAIAAAVNDGSSGIAAVATGAEVAFDFTGTLTGDYVGETSTTIGAATDVAQAVAADDGGSDTTAPVDVPTAPVTSVATADDARVTIKAIDKAIMTVNIQRSELGAVSNRLSHTVNNLTNISSNLSAAQGGIEDADFAHETTMLAKNQILQQASTAMLAQANASKQNVLSLLQG